MPPRTRRKPKPDDPTQPLPTIPTRPSEQALALADGHGWDAIHEQTRTLRDNADDAIAEIDMRGGIAIKGWFTHGLLRLQREHDKLVAAYFAERDARPRPLPALGQAWPDDDTVPLYELPAPPEVIDAELLPHPDDPPAEAEVPTGPMAPAFEHDPRSGFFDAAPKDGEGGD